MAKRKPIHFAFVGCDMEGDHCLYVKRGRRCLSEPDLELVALDLIERLNGDTAPTRIWISVLVPAVGADIYDGTRIQAALSEADCYRDLAEWLEIEYESVEQVTLAMEEAADDDGDSETKLGYRVRTWKVKVQEVSRA